MVDFHHAIQKNPLKTKKDVQKAVLELTEPLAPYYSKGGALLKLDNTGAHFFDRSAHMEGFSRILWALGPLMAGGGDSPLVETYLKGFENGSDPTCEEYWGDFDSIDQRMVEMAAISLSLILAKDRFWDPLSQKAKDSLIAYLNKVNMYEPAPSNWLFFRVMVDMAFYSLGLPYDEALLNKTLEKIDTFYLGDGWYSDGIGGKRDYYNPFAIHFYSLIFSVVMKDKYPEKSRLFKERAELFAKEFIYWCDTDGATIPFGRSLTYRFALGSFWSALAFAGTDKIPMGVIKGIVLRHLRWWFEKPIFARDGILTIGYAYPNLFMSEDYNSPGSPYWAFKTFLPLALSDDHPFWTSEELPLPELNDTKTQPKPGFLIQRLAGGSNVVALTSGQFVNPGYLNFDSKYSKFAYSTKFGFSVSKSYRTLELGAFDSMLALKEEGEAMYQVRCEHELTKIDERSLHSVWSPYQGVDIETILIACGEWHVRLHKIVTDRVLETAEGGFSIGREDFDSKRIEWKTENAIAAAYDWGVSGIVNLLGNRTPSLVVTEANTNLMFPRAILPNLKGKIDKGTHVLACAVFAGCEKSYCEKEWEHAPVLTVQDGIFKIEHEGKVLNYSFEN